jgi:A/G-specific adenine glycosylase
MLQQTTVAAATPYFRRFTERWPEVGALAAAEEGEVLAAWAGLGYYARARNLVACARRVASPAGGGFPTPKVSCARCPASAPTRPRRSRRSPSTGPRWWSTATWSG